MSDVLPDFMQPSPSFSVLGEEFPNKLEAIDALAKRWAGDFRLAYLKKEGINIISKAATLPEQEAIRCAVQKAIDTLSQTEAAQNSQVQVGGTAVSQAMIEGGYAGMTKVETMPDEWVWMPAKNQTGAMYINLSEPYYEVSAKVMNARINVKQWPMVIGEDGQPKRSAMTGQYMRIAPSDAHLSYDNLRVQNITMDPWRNDVVYVNDLGERVLNQYRPIKYPPRPEAKYFEIVPLIQKWVEFIYPGRSEYIFDHFKHMLCSLESKASTHLVFGGGQGIGKNVLLSLFTYTHNRQGKVSVIEKNQITMPHTDYLMRPIMIVDEFEMRRSEVHYMLVKERLKAWTGSSEKWLAVHPKGKPATQVANIHRLIITTNNPHQIPRDNDDRRYAIMNSAATEAEVHEFIKPLFAALGFDITHPEFAYRRMWEEGYGDAFALFLMDRDYSADFNPNKLPRALLDQYDESTRGFEIPESMRLALDEIALTFGRWDWIKDGGSPHEWPADLSDVTRKHWPKFVAAQHLKATHSAFFDEVDGETVRDSKNLDTLCRNADYVLLQSDSAQWRGPIPTRDSATGSVRVQTKLYCRKDAFPNGTTMDQKRVEADKFVKLLTEYWRSEEGVATYWSEKRVKDLEMKRGMRAREKAKKEIDDEM